LPRILWELADGRGGRPDLDETATTAPGQRFTLSRPWNHVVSCEEQSDEAISTSESISGEALIFGH
jgi:hypothetical protein